MPQTTAGPEVTPEKAISIVLAFLDDVTEAKSLSEVQTAALMARMELSGIEVER